MIYRDFQGKKLPLLGLGTMRLPLVEGGKAGDIDEERVARMVEIAMGAGVNYFDTAYPYHEGKSELVMGRVLKKYPRESFYLADKYPGHQLAETYDPEATFEEQLKKCGVEYFDFYLIHNVYENSVRTYNDPKWNILPYFIEQKRLGRIKHLGFSTHGSLSVMEAFLDKWGEHMEFCQIQLNYLDHTLQNAAAKVELLKKRGLPVWVMEPLRGGKLAKPDEKAMAALGEGADPVSLAFRYFHGNPDVAVVLSGMSTEEQLLANIKIFSEEKPLQEGERKALFAAAETMKNSVPCTACGYCMKDCPKGLDIPLMLSVYNELQVVKTFLSTMRLEALPEEKMPAACIACGKCARNCPQGIDVPAVIGKLTATLKEVPSWSQICRERAEAAKKSKA